MAEFGSFSERIEIETDVGEEGSPIGDGAGGYGQEWALFATMWAEVEPMRGAEQIQAMQIEGNEIYKVTMRRLADVDTSMRIKWTTNGNKLLNIRYVQDAGPRDTNMVLMCEAGVET